MHRPPLLLKQHLAAEKCPALHPGRRMTKAAAFSRLHQLEESTMHTTVAETGGQSSAPSARHTIALVFGVLMAISGINHGIFEALQGWKPTNGVVVQAIGEAQRMWSGGTEEAFTIVPNFLLTGILAVCVGCAAILWSALFLSKRRGALIFLLLFVALFLVGGGIAQLLFFLPVWAYATRINKPMPWWRKVLSGRVGKGLASIWKVSLVVASLLFLVALEMAIFGFFPGVSDPDTLLYICWGCLAVSWILMHLTFISGFAADLAREM